MMDCRTGQLSGGRSYYGYQAGILCLPSAIPRPVGDPGNAQTFDFPVLHEVVEGVSFRQILDRDHAALPHIIDAANKLETKGVRFILSTCGLYAPLQRAIAARLSVPFIGSALHAVPFLHSLLPADQRIGVLTGHAGLLCDEHVVPSGFRLADVCVHGMEDYPEFRRVVLEGAQDMDFERMQRDATSAASALTKACEGIGMLVLECPNLVPFRASIQAATGLPVYDIVSLAGLIASGFSTRDCAARCR